MHNDYLFYSYDNESCCGGFPETKHLLLIGRPLGALLLNIQFSFIHSVNSLGFNRIISFILLFLSFLISSLILQLQGYRKKESIILSILCFSLPAPALYIIWVTNLIPGSLCILYSTIIYYLFLKGPSHRSNKYFPVWLFVGMIPVFLVYPSSAFIILFYSCTKVSIDNRRHVFRLKAEYIRDILILLSLSISLFIYVKIFNSSIILNFLGLSSTDIQSGYSTSVGLDPTSSLTKFTEYTTQSFSLWFDGWMGVIPLTLTSLFIIYRLSSLYVFSRSNTHLQHSASKTFQFYVYLFGVFIFSSLPITISAAGFVATRNGFAGSAIAMLIVYNLLCSHSNSFELRQRSSPSIYVLIIPFITFCLRIYSTSYSLSVELGREVALIKNKLHASSLNAKTIPQPNGFFFQLPKRNETVIGSSIVNKDFAFAGLNRNPIDGFIRAGLVEAGMTPFQVRRMNIHTVPTVDEGYPYQMQEFDQMQELANRHTSTPDKYFHPDPDNHPSYPYIDTSKIYSNTTLFDSDPNRRITKTTLFYQLSLKNATNSHRNPLFLFDPKDSGPDSFWEISLPHGVPYHVTFFSKKLVKVHCLVIQSGPDELQRMPTQIAVQYLNNKTWTTYHVIMLANWRNNEQRLYKLPVKRLASFRYLLINTKDDIMRIYGLKPC